MEIQDLIKEYETKTDDELLRLALDSEQLTPEATTALNNELAKRRINGSERLNVLRSERQHHEAERRKNPGSLFVVTSYGIGRKRFGKADYEYSSETGMERFKDNCIHCVVLASAATHRNLLRGEEERIPVG